MSLTHLRIKYSDKCPHISLKLNRRLKKIWKVQIEMAGRCRERFMRADSKEMEEKDIMKEKRHLT
jgi:hypothetical protein